MMTLQTSFGDSTLNGVRVLGDPVPGQREILTPEAIDFLAALHRAMEPRRRELMGLREERRDRIAGGATLDFLPETRKVREDASWHVAPLAPGLKDRRVEITGPVDRKMTINAMNSGARGWLADFEDSSTPSWENVIAGQVNLRDAIRGTISLSAGGKEYQLNGEALTDHPTINVRPRGLHLMEDRIEVDGSPVSGALTDFALYFFHNAKELVARGRGPYFYLPKTESHLEARWWNCVFVRAQDLLAVPQGTVRATVLIETITAAFEMEEILYQLRNHAAGLNAGRWDYIFSIIKTFRDRGADFVLPDRSEVTMTQPMMRAYTELLVRTCHRRGASAIGGMAAQIPSRKDAEANAAALEKVRADKSREAGDGFDGSWVAHPDLVPVAMEVFDGVLGEEPNQIRTRRREDVVPDAAALIDVRSTVGSITERGLRTNIEVGIRYLESWLRGNGAAAIHNLMEDAATAEISRSQLWQWVNAGSTAKLTDGGERTVTREWVQQLTDEEFAAIERTEGDRFDDAREVFTSVALAEEFPDFLTLPAYERFLSAEARARREATGGTPA
ncbi:malate synthase A [Micrococcus sp. 2A]|uniref:malate synthase A n=1 Tax=Micrococcus sp. 2A TaxID=3142261 RepID=UPI002633EC99|nr:malate synthase A [uncultured Micrococcus sp.]